MSSLKKRRDKRSEETFAHNIEDFTEREFYWGIALRFDFLEKGQKCSIEEHGVDNTGKLIEGRLPNHNVDKIFYFEDRENLLIEIKTIPEYVKNFFTFKSYALKCCRDQKAWILVPRSEKYYLFPPKTCGYIFEKYKHQIYPKFSANDPAVRLYTSEIIKLIENKKIIEKEWAPKVKSYIQDNYDILFREKKK
jgi:hypothetical protein